MRMPTYRPHTTAHDWQTSTSRLEQPQEQAGDARIYIQKTTEEKTHTFALYILAFLTFDLTSLRAAELALPIYLVLQTW